METQPKRLVEILTDFRSAMFVTRGAGGELKGRPMGLADVEKDDGDIWFATSIDSSMVDEVRADAKVVVTLQSSMKFATVSGTAEIVRDRAVIAQKWNDSWKVWFPQGKDDPTIALIKVRAAKAEFWDMTGTKGVAFLWEAAKAYVQGRKPEPVEGQHGVAKMQH